MLMTILEQEDKLCTCCMENHVVKIVQVVEHATYKGVAVKYVATYNFCDESDEIFSDEGMIEANDINKKNAYRKVIGLLTTDEIKAIRAKYDISQTDFSTILGWGLKTITRYEGHAVQDKAHDSILRKLSNDPEWFVELLKNSKDSDRKSVV